MFSVQDKFRISPVCGNDGRVRRLPADRQALRAARRPAFFYIGEQLEWDVELAIPAGAIELVRLARFGQLGWTSWMAPNWSQTDRAYRCDARFHPAEILKAAGAPVPTIFERNEHG